MIRWIYHKEWQALAIPKCGVSSLYHAAGKSHSVDHADFLAVCEESEKDLFMGYTPKKGLPIYVPYRDPVERFSSCYYNKVASGVNYFRFGRVTPSEFVHIMSRQFAKNAGNLDILDEHIRPQSCFWKLLDGLEFTFIETSELDRLQGVEKVCNRTGGGKLKNQLFTKKEVNTVGKMYSDDYKREIFCNSSLINK